MIINAVEVPDNMLVMMVKDLEDKETSTMDIHTLGP